MSRLRKSLGIPTFAVALFSGLAHQANAQETPPLPNDFRLVYSQNFEGPSWRDQFVMTDPLAWRSGTAGGGDAANKTLELFGKSDYQPPHRSPFNIAFIKETVVGDFILDVKLLQTGKEYGHRDMCLFFGFQDPAHFYYVHMATATDDHAHNLFIVNEAPRIKISEKTSKGVQWGTQVWHHVRLIRRTGSGLIQVFFDDMETPIMQATDTHFGTGHIGFGSFDDTGMVDDIRLWSNQVSLKPIPPFKP